MMVEAALRWDAISKPFSVSLGELKVHSWEIKKLWLVPISTDEIQIRPVRSGLDADKDGCSECGSVDGEGGNVDGEGGSVDGEIQCLRWKRVKYCCIAHRTYWNGNRLFELADLIKYSRTLRQDHLLQTWRI